MAYKAIIRPALEFGLTVMPPIKAVLKMLDVHTPAERKWRRLRVMCALPSFQHRHIELQARRFVALDGRSRLHMTRHAQSVASSPAGASSKSSFRAWDTNHIAQRYRKESLLAKIRRLPKEHRP